MCYIILPIFVQLSIILLDLRTRPSVHSLYFYYLRKLLEMEAISFYSERLPASLNNWYRSYGTLCETLLAWMSAMELAGVNASEWETPVQVVEGLLWLRWVLQLIQKSQDPLSDLIKCGFSNLYAKLDYNNDLVVLADETRYIKDTLFVRAVCNPIQCTSKW